MKRAFRIIVPILLIIAVILSIGWYFVKYDPELTRDLLVWQARNLDDRGNHALATWFYKMAYQQSGNDETIALELAEQYRSSKNYTKAEFTLSNAIADGGSVELYIALCNIYVEQDKLLDAVTMLDNVADQTIKAQLDALRPKAPSPSHESGFYNQYISVSFSAPEGTIYLTTDGLYPSTGDPSYTSAMALSAGETVIHGLTVGSNGLVSPLFIGSYTISGVVEEVTINDPAIDQTIRQQLQVDSDHTLYTNELWNIKTLTIPHDTKSLSDLSKLPFLETLLILDLDSPTPSSIDALDLTPLSKLTSLKELGIANMTMSAENLQVIGELPALTMLSITHCDLSGISQLAGATKLTHLDLSRNTIGNLSALEGMTQLTNLNLCHNAISDVSSIGKLTNLTVLDLSYNSITDTAPLASCTFLVSLKLAGNALTELAGVENLTALIELSVAFNKLTDVQVLENCTEMLELDLSNNELTDISFVSAMTKLMTLNFSHNQVQKLPEFSMDSPLIAIKGSNNNLSSLDELAGLESLNYIMMDFNADISSVNALAGCYALIEVSVYGTKVREVNALTDMGVIVKYQPI
ncbi:MAG: leucine-rich repeat domain-containing protein [Oscillospiraceae bacterium]|nr:leucine-rich repeat domain-containing protein [Oscillospiraceae bacterium]